MLERDEEAKKDDTDSSLDRTSADLLAFYHQRFQLLVGDSVNWMENHGVTDDWMSKCYASQEEFKREFPTTERQRAIVETLDMHQRALDIAFRSLGGFSRRRNTGGYDSNDAESLPDC